MGIFLQILGALTLLILLLFVGGFFWIRYKLRTALGDISEIMAANMAVPVPPMQISLHGDFAMQWHDDAAVKKLAASLHELGFHSVGEFEIEELPVKLQAWILPDDAMYAVIYEHALAGVYADITTEYAPHGALTVSSAPHGHELEHRPNYDKIYLRDASIEELCALMRRERRDGEYRAISASDFADRFAQFYADEMEWRCTQGGVSEAEIRRIAEESNIKVDDATITQQVEWNQRIAAQNLSESVQNYWLQNSTLSAAQWENSRERLLIIHQHLPVFMIEEIVLDLAQIYDDENGEALNLSVPIGCDARERFRLLNERLPSARRAEKLDDTVAPIAADIYLRPIDDNRLLS